MNIIVTLNQGRILALISFVALLGQCLAVSGFTFQDDEGNATDKRVKVIFQNTTKEKVYLRALLLDDDKENPNIEVFEVDKNQPINRDREKAYKKIDQGFVWEIVNGKKEVLAQYVTNDDDEQYVDIAGLIANQSTKVKIYFKNNTDQPVDVFWTSNEGKRIQIVDDWPANTELNEPLSSLPNQLWTIEQDGKFFADYFPNTEREQVVDLKELKTWFEPVKITFTNRTDTPLDIYLVDLDGELIKYSGERPLVNEALEQPAQPLTKWLIKNGDDAVAVYIATNEKQQECQIDDEYLNNYRNESNGKSQ